MTKDGLDMHAFFACHNTSTFSPFPSLSRLNAHSCRPDLPQAASNPSCRGPLHLARRHHWRTEEATADISAACHLDMQVYELDMELQPLLLSLLAVCWYAAMPQGSHHGVDMIASSSFAPTTVPADAMRSCWQMPGPLQASHCCVCRGVWLQGYSKRSSSGLLRQRILRYSSASRFYSINLAIEYTIQTCRFEQHDQGLAVLQVLVVPSSCMACQTK